MSAATRFVLLFTPVPHQPDVREVAGVFYVKEHAMSYARELVTEEGMTSAGFEIEGWRGRDFVGAWNFEGTLVEDAKGRERNVPTAEEPKQSN